jgi:multidrug efflux pump
MGFTDLFIRRPVLASVVSLLILVLGLRAALSLSVRQYPVTQNAVVTVSTTYFGADPALVAGFITTPLENSIAQANGIDYLTSTSTQGSSNITATLRLNYESSRALTEINTRVNAVLNQLPTGTQQPVITVTVGDTIDSMYIGFSSPPVPGTNRNVLETNQITDYLIRVAQPKIQAVEGVQTAEILGKRQFALRAWLDPKRMAALGVTGTDVSNALANNDFISAVGRTQGQMVTINLLADTGLHSVEQFKNLVVKSQNNANVRLGDVANLTLGSEDYDSAVGFDGKVAVYIGIKVAPNANLLTVIDNVRKVFPSIQQELPEGLDGAIVYDATKFVNSSINEVISTLVKTLLIVTVVIFLFLGSFRSVLIPVIAMPLSLIGTFFVMLMFGYTINLLTLLALVLAIGLVVDDAIIVVENVNRHIEDGKTTLEASLLGARELVGPIIAMTVVLVAVYLPIGFTGGLTGALFTEFAFTLAGAVTVSAIVALTLSPMMCSKFLLPHDKDGGSRLVQFIDRQFNRVRHFYEATLSEVLGFLVPTAIFAAIALVSVFFLYAGSKAELTPQEDQGIVIAFATTAPNATLEQTQLNSRQIFNIFKTKPEMDHVFQLDGLAGLNSSIAGIVLKPWDERKKSANQIQTELQGDFSHIAGARIAAFQPPSLPGGGGGLPIQFVITTTDSYDRLNQVAQDFQTQAQASGMFIFLDNDLKFDKPQSTVEFDRDKTALLGLSMKDVGNSLGSMLGGGYVNYFSLAGRSYRVIPQVMQKDRLNADQLKDYYVNTKSGASIPISTIASLKDSVVPESLNHFQQLNSATISGVQMPGVAGGDALDKMEEIAAKVLPQGYSVDFGGQSRQLKQESSAFTYIIIFALIMIFLALAAQFESFRDPLIVLISVPMSICGAMVFIDLGVHGASLNIYTKVGLVTLVGLISKHGILIVQFANDQQREGYSKFDAIVRAAAIRLRPILMTTAAMVLGVVPLVFASGAGAAGRFSMGLVIMTGISIGTLFTLFVVPAIYMLLAADHHEAKQAAGAAGAGRRLDSPNPFTT